MDPSSREDLSALMDGELAAEPTRFLLRRLDHDPDLAAAWSRWHLIRACLTSDRTHMTASRHDNDFAARVAGALQPAPERVPRVPPHHWVRYLGGGAIAAGVAFAALMLNIPNPGSEPSSAPVAQSHRTAAPAAAVPTSLAEASVPAMNPVIPPSLLSRQPTVLSAQPASANVVYGTGFMQPDYLRRANYARGAALPFGTPFDAGQYAPPFSIFLPPESPASSAAAGQR